jgi:hypothetical protein
MKNQFQPELVERYKQAILHVCSISYRRKVNVKSIKAIEKKYTCPVVFTTLLVRLNCLFRTAPGTYTWNEKMKLDNNGFRQKAIEMIAMNREGAKKSIQKKNAPKPKPAPVVSKETANLTTVEIAIKVLKSAGYKVMKPTSGWEEI